MKPNVTIALVVGVNVILLFLHIHKSSVLVAESYRKQKNEHLKQELSKKKDMLTQSLYTAKNHTAIKNFATKKLGMEPIRLSQIKTYAAHEKPV